MIDPTRRRMLAAIGLSALLGAQETPAGTLIVHTAEPGVRIRLNGITVGTTPANGALKLQLRPGRYALVAEKEGYQAALSEVVVIAKQTTETPSH